jgi:hypothetical protein
MLQAGILLGLLFGAEDGSVSPIFPVGFRRIIPESKTL